MAESKEVNENMSKDIDEIYLDYPFVSDIKRVLKESKKKDEKEKPKEGD